MKLLKIFDKRKIKFGYQPITYRDSARAIIFKEGKILLVYSEVSNEYKFPGGGLKEEELREYALRREVLEETGKKIKSVNEPLGYVDQIYNDIYDYSRYFYLRSYYYFCEIEEGDYELELDNYELELKFVPVWVTLDEAINANQKVHDMGSPFHWTERELYVLKLLRRMQP